MSIKRSYTELTIKANGKADLYFHAYIWHTYLVNLFLKVHNNLTEKEFDE